MYRLYLRLFPSSQIYPVGKYVLISGCDTGFGHALAIKLDHYGFNVLAGVYVADSIPVLQKKLSDKAIVFRLDITRQEDIDAAFALVNEKTKVLHGLVNNAGIAAAGYVDWASMDTFHRVMDVNFFGHVAMTKRFLPLLVAKRDSRVVNVSSMCGYISLPGSSAYCASKHALEAFSDCLRREMAPWNLRVSIIEPGTMRTTMTEGMEDALKNVWFQLPGDVHQRWGEEFFQKTLRSVIDSPFIKYSEDASKVIRAIDHALTSRRPGLRYKPGWQTSLVFFPLSMLPAWLVDKMFSFALSDRPAGVIYQDQ